jgi:hypothetical protein
MRIFTDINFSKGRADYHLQSFLQVLFLLKTPLADRVNRWFALRNEQAV